MPLPAVLWQLAEVKIDLPNDWDSHFVPPERMRALAEVITAEWDEDDDIFEVMPPSVKARYERSVVVYVEVGDGLGALAWDPAGDLGQNRPAAPGGVWFWMHQGDIDSPELLLDGEDQPRDAEAALTNVFQRFVLNSDDLEHTADLVVDTAHPRNLLQLNFNDGKYPHLWLRSYGYDYSMY